MGKEDSAIKIKEQLLTEKPGYVRCDGSQGKRTMQEGIEEEKGGAFPFVPNISWYCRGITVSNAAER